MDGFVGVRNWKDGMGGKGWIGVNGGRGWVGGKGRGRERLRWH